jgi:hypothetical protein
MRLRVTTGSRDLVEASTRSQTPDKFRLNVPFVEERWS